MIENRKIKITKKALKEALLELLQEKNITQISVTELCQAADINRSTFYSHYETLLDVLDDIENEFLIHIPFYDATQSFPREKQRFVTYITYIQNHKTEFLVLLENGRLIERIYIDTRKLYATAETDSKRTQKYDYLSFYACHGSFQMIAHWLKTNQTDTANELAELLLELIVHINNVALSKD